MYSKTCLKQTLLNRALSLLKMFFSCVYVQGKDRYKIGYSNSQSTTNKMQRFSNLVIYVRHSTCFRQFSHPSSGAQNCTYSVRYRYCHLLLATGGSNSLTNA